MGPLVKAGLLLSLNRYAAKYGWSSRYSAGILRMNRFTADAKNFGLKRVVLPKGNEPDILELKPELVEGLEVLYVEKYEQVFDIVFGGGAKPAAKVAVRAGSKRRSANGRNGQKAKARGSSQ